MSNGTSFNYEEGVWRELYARTDVHVCRSARVANCVAGASLFSSAAIGIASIVVSRSKAISCADTGVLQTTTTPRVYFKYSATGTNCDTTVEIGTVQGAVTKWFKDNSCNRVCGIQCLRLDHEGSWHGYVAVGTSQNAVKYASCNQNSGGWTACDQGGKNDV